MLAYVYGVVPLSLCRNGGCGLRGSSSHSVNDKDDLVSVSFEDSERILDHEGLNRYCKLIFL